MKRLVWVLLASALLLLCVMAFPKAVHAEESGDFQFEVENATITITTYTGSGPVVVIPEKINGMDVTRIARVGGYWDPRSKVDQFKSLEIPKSVVDIQSDALVYCTSLTEIHVNPANDFYQSLDGILYNKSMDRLVSYPQDRKGDQFVIPESVTNIDDLAFYRCNNLHQVTVMGTVKRIGKQAFGACKGLTDIILSEGIAQIDDEAFCGCSELKALRIPASVESISPFEFGSSDWGLIKLEEILVDPKNEHYASLDGILYDKALTTLIKYPENRPGESYAISSSVKAITESAFLNCMKLQRLYFPDSLRTIGPNALRGCQRLKEVNIPDSVTSIGPGAFSDCFSLTTLQLPGQLAKLSDSLCMGCSNLSQIDIPDNVLSIGNLAFAECAQLTSIRIPTGLQSIGDRAFSGCEQLTSILVPVGIQSIGSGAFTNCQRLTSMIIPSGIEQIMSGTFSGCIALTSVSLPYGVKRIDEQAFYKCSSLTQISIPDSVDVIGQKAFAYCSKLKSIQLPERINRLEDGTFASCSSLAAIHVPTQVNTIASDAFDSCINLRAINVAVENPTYSSQDGVLYNKTRTSLIKYPEAAPNRQYIIPDGVAEIEPHALIYSEYLQNVTIPVSVKRIGTEAFLFCSNLDYASFLGNAPAMGEDVFEYCNDRFTIYCLAGRSGYTDLGYPVQILKTGNLSVTFKDWNGSVLSSDLVAYGQSASAPADPVREGYSFSGWDKTFATVQNDLTVTALYQASSPSGNAKHKQLFPICSAILIVASGIFILILWKRRQSRN